MTEKEKMQKGMWYDANFDKQLLAERIEADGLCYEFNHTHPKEAEKRAEILDKLLPNKGENVSILAPFIADYGKNCFIGEGTFINYGAYLMDGAPITIGKSCFIGPNCGFYTAIHPIDAEERSTLLESAEPINVGNDVWFGGNVTVLPGVTIGSNVVIGAGSVVTRDISDNSLAAGNPCHVIRELSEKDSIKYKKDLF